MEKMIRNAVRRFKEVSVRAVKKAEQLHKYGNTTGREELAALASGLLKNRKLILSSNREPYTHVFREGKPFWYRSAGGLTIALDSVAAACDAVWVCQGDGAADYTVTGNDGKVRVPPDHPKYSLKRIKLTPEEVSGFYEGFSNEGLWPLSHVSYVRPKFLRKNWETYRDVNQKFAEAIAEEASPSSIVFLQDYHMCLTAKYLKERIPGVTTVLFWHIPWPNPEIFRICPWKKEVLEGLLANDILGFHLGYHADNFMETVALELEGRVDWERMMVQRGEKNTRIRSYPISIDFKAILEQASDAGVEEKGRELRESMNLGAVQLGVGVDRIDYTKGIPERINATERMLEKYPEHIGKYVFIQLGVPSRSNLEDYQDVVRKIEDRVAEVNGRFRSGNWEPLVFLKGHHDFNTLIPFYRMADVCVVSSLHDGMNLVAKEFVAASDPDRGVLVLSKFTGAARELEQAILINPYDTETFADALHQALVIPQEERKARLERMRITVAGNNIYDWAMSILNDVVRLAEDTGFAAK
jgi:trehalose 6-phosphate synthase